MPVVINEFEVLPEAPAPQVSRAAENSDAGSKTKEKPDFHHTWRHLHQRAKRLRAH
jgi:hypothetical protein